MAALTLDTQELSAAACVPDPAEPQPFWDPHDASSRLRDVALELVPESTGAGARPGRSPVTHLLVTVVCREGRVIDTIAEHRWFGAWRYSNHLTSAVDGDVYVVTPHGWTGVMDHARGTSLGFARGSPSHRLRSVRSCARAATASSLRTWTLQPTSRPRTPRRARRVM